MKKYISISIECADNIDKIKAAEVNTLLKAMVASVLVVLKTKYSGIITDIKYNNFTGTVIINDANNVLNYEFYNIGNELNHILDIAETTLHYAKLKIPVSIRCFEWDHNNMEGQFDYITMDSDRVREQESLSVGSDNNINVKEMLFTYLIEAAIDVSEDTYNTFIEYKDNMHSEYMKQLEKDKPSEIQVVKKELEAKMNRILEELADIKDVLFNIDNKTDLIK